MRLLLCPDKFKGTFTAPQVCALLEQGIRQEDPGAEVTALPLADGGEGTLDVLMAALGGTRVAVRVCGPMGRPISAEYGVTPDGVAVIESARFCGLALVAPKDRDPMAASSYGLGEGIAAALDAGARRFVLGLGGSATVDAGTGMARALGYRFEDETGREVTGVGPALAAIQRLDSSLAHPALAHARFTALCDVSHPLCGPGGAARVFAPQKGAGPADVDVLEAGLEQVARAIAAWQRTDPLTVGARPSGGAAGGLGAGAAAFLGAALEPGAIFLMRTLFFTDRARGMDALVTGEGALDAQTAGGKVVAAVLAEAARLGIRAVVVAGRWDGTVPSPAPSLVQVVGPPLPWAGENLDAAGLVEAGCEAVRRLRAVAKQPDR
jgi:glycerate kinase